MRKGGTHTRFGKYGICKPGKHAETPHRSQLAASRLPVALLSVSFRIIFFSARAKITTASLFSSVRVGIARSLLVLGFPPWPQLLLRGISEFGRSSELRGMLGSAAAPVSGQLLAPGVGNWRTSVFFFGPSVRLVFQKLLLHSVHS